MRRKKGSPRRYEPPRPARRLQISDETWERIQSMGSELLKSDQPIPYGPGLKACVDRLYGLMQRKKIDAQIARLFQEMEHDER